MTGVIIREDAVADALDAVAHDQHGGGGEQRRDREGQKLRPERLRVFFDQSQRRELHDQRQTDQREDQAGVHLT